MSREINALTSEAVERLVAYCLYGDERPIDEAIVVQGITRNFGFDRDRITESTPEIERLIEELPDAFLMTGGGGWTFLNLCQNRYGHQWTSFHQKMEEFCCLAIAAKRAIWLLPRDVWGLLPGGMPYVGFKTGASFEYQG